MLIHQFADFESCRSSIEASFNTFPKSLERFRVVIVPEDRTADVCVLPRLAGFIRAAQRS